MRRSTRNSENIDKIMEHILRYTKENGISPEIASEYAIGNNVVVGNAQTLLLGYCKSGFINVHKNPNTDPLYLPLNSFLTKLAIISL